MDVPFKIHQSALAGKGAFATSHIAAGEHICRMQGEEISLREYIRRLKSKKENSGDGLQVDDERYIDLQEKYRDINHSCNPNAGIRGKNELFALCDIKKGEEITYDYSTTMWDDAEKLKKVWLGGLWTMRCKCGAGQCRKIIGQFYELPLKLQRKYFKMGAVAGFIRNRLTNL